MFTGAVGGTRLGEGLRRFNDEWGIRGLARGAVVVIFSDGWDRGEPEVLAEQMARLGRVAHRIVWVNPLLVTVFQVRLTSSASRFSPAHVLVAAMLIMGLPFLLLTWSHALVTVLVVAVLFVIGEMLWVPTSQAIVARLAPEEMRGAYFGAMGSTAAVGWALAPLLGLQSRNSFGDAVTWAMFAWLSAAVIRASSRNIAMNSSCSLNEGRIRFSATNFRKPPGPVTKVRNSSAIPPTERRVSTS